MTDEWTDDGYENQYAWQCTWFVRMKMSGGNASSTLTLFLNERNVVRRQT